MFFCSLPQPIISIGGKLDDVLLKNKNETTHGIDPNGSTDLGHIIIRKMLMDIYIVKDQRVMPAGY